MSPPEQIAVPDGTVHAFTPPMNIDNQATGPLLPPPPNNSDSCLKRACKQALQWNDALAIPFGRVVGYAYGPSCLFARDTHQCCGPWPESQERSERGWNSGVLGGLGLSWFFLLPPPFNIVMGTLGLTCSASQAISCRSDNCTSAHPISVTMS